MCEPLHITGDLAARVYGGGWIPASAECSRTCKRPSGIVTRAPPSCMIGAGKIEKGGFNCERLPFWAGRIMSERKVERRLAAILAADVVGYSRLVGEDEEGTLERLKVLRRTVADPKIKEHRGRVVRTMGDGLLVEFASVVDAGRCSVWVRPEMALRNAALPSDRRIEVRIGITLRELRNDRRDIIE